ncbi:MAG: LuxR family transcriptional regulator [Confluentimicrobium sp.]|jgi:LuxR family transcriptional regulator|uniref:LuxR family transcriptional regulator n=1 Tax=Actibacterium naphthalenivorans TaxID=1614693 RepID=A0A840C8P3_9RHOB|nr:MULTISPECIES: autoinducer binding domain-containing protein [Actibacterium]KGB81361.1 LuxR family transcriptional regulator [Rhodovulum sp. NI22]MDY6857918.1 autoinducer binding domain-containing protein [Pseudomonadota bacterium]ALG89181.1 LuxR family transcriptional regulator [Actibacterium sp. EMB200-NS6]MBB4021243.1 LuxR family transcriptional regulator [Actibacterium naphthalenivorans]MBC56205.1 LuxR family transcriptional regulator [Actibacterium sp.]|tara:strand:- start:1801 stop:2412 length:612 start_codon:yes stop_codon:yes gene_type:complete
MFEKSVFDRELQTLDALAPMGYFLGLHIRFTAPLMTLQTYDQAWMDHYTENGYVLRDPMTAWGFSATGSTRWSSENVPDPFGIFQQAAKFGLRYGATISCGPISSRTIASVGRADREFFDAEIEQIEALVHRLHDMTEPPQELTKAQIEALKCIADGDRHAAAAAKLGISESALKARLSSARLRLMSRTTAEAIQRAKDYRLL